MRGRRRADEPRKRPVGRTGRMRSGPEPLTLAHGGAERLERGRLQHDRGPAVGRNPCPCCPDRHRSAGPDAAWRDLHDGTRAWWLGTERSRLGQVCTRQPEYEQQNDGQSCKSTHSPSPQEEVPLRCVTMALIHPGSSSQSERDPANKASTIPRISEFGSCHAAPGIDPSHLLLANPTRTAHGPTSMPVSRRLGAPTTSSAIRRCPLV